MATSVVLPGGQILDYDDAGMPVCLQVWPLVPMPPKPPLVLTCPCGADLWLVRGWVICSKGCGRLKGATGEQAAELTRLERVVEPNNEWRKVGKQLREVEHDD